MNFLTPLFFLGAAALVGPIIFHLIRRSTKEKTPFSSLMFLRPTPPKLTQRSRLDHILLLILRCLALALLAFGFARPFLRHSLPADGTAGQSKRIVVLVDTSASMRRAGLWDAAKQRAETAIRKATPVDQVAVFTFGRGLHSLLSFEEWQAAPVSERATMAVSRLAAISPSWEGTQLDAALIGAGEALADNLTAKTTGPRLVVLVSDLQSGSQLSALQSYEWPKNVQLQVEAVKASHPTNAGLQLVAEAADADRQTEPTVRARVSNATDSTREQFKLSWARSDGTLAGAAINLYVPPGQSRVLAVPVPKGAAVDRIVLSGDDEPFDNTIYAIPPEKQRISAIYLGSERAEDARQPLFFLERALPDTPRFGVQLFVHGPSSVLPPAEVEAAKLFVVTESLSTETAAALRAQVLEGRTLLFAPKTAASASTLANLLALPSLEMSDARPDNYGMLSEIDFQDPLFAAFADPRFSDFTKIHIWKYRRLAANAIPDARAVARFDNGDPALLSVTVGKGRVLVLLSGWQPDDSQLGVSSKFVPLVYSILEASGASTSSPAQYFVGDELPLTAGKTATVRRPDGSTVMLVPESKRVLPTTMPGIYELAVEGSVQRFAVNLAPTESRTAPLPLDELERFGAPTAPSEAAAAKAAEREVILQGAEMEGRQKLWRWFIATTLGVLLIESLLAGWTSRRAAVSGGPTS